MVEMIQRIFRSFEHNNLGALYPPPEGTGFTARVIKMSENPDVSMVKAFDCIKGGSFTRGPGAVICLTSSPCFLKPDVIAHSIWDI